jgi:protein-S-isoprenylcysteine O-methyltransferase Ste14
MALSELGEVGNKIPNRQQVVVPPPLVFIAAILLGIILDFLLPIELLPGVVQLSVGLPLVGFAVFLSAVSFRTFIKHGTTSGHRRKPCVLITGGPFRYTRNPLYLSGLVLVLGIAVLLDGLWIAVFAPPAAIIVHYRAVLKEETLLHLHFGMAYQQYRSTVRRWI